MAAEQRERVDPAVSDPTEVEGLRQRLRRIAEEKSFLQLIIRLLERLNPLVGIDNMLAAMLTDIAETIGGTDIKLWYWFDGELRRVSFLSGACVVSAIDDALAEQVRCECRVLEQEAPLAGLLLNNEVGAVGTNVAFPLMVGQDLVGVIKLENTHRLGRTLRTYLPIFFSHAALILSNEARKESRLRVQQKLQELSRDFVTFLEQTPDFVYLKGIDDRYRFCSQSMAELTGHADWRDMIGKHDQEIGSGFFPEIANTTEQAVLAQSEQVPPRIHPYHDRSGQLRYALSNQWPIFDEGKQQVVGLLGMSRDITEMKLAEDKLRLAASVFANTQEGILISDSDNHIVDVNAAFVRLTGYSSAEVIGKNPNILASGRHDRAFYRQMWVSLKDNACWSGEIWNQRKNGQLYPERLSITVVHDQAGQLINYVAVFSDISLAKAHEAELEQVAYYDSLTGLPNRRLLADRLTQAVARNQRYQESLALCYLDLDGFKPINDRWGHAAGDQVLIEVARRLQAELRVGDTLARLGGDEFVLLLSKIGDHGAICRVLERILHTLSEPIMLGAQSVQVSGSIGVTLCPEDSREADALLRHADQAMYQAKAKGKNCYQFFDAEQDRRLSARQDDREGLALALSRGEFELHYQPKVDLLKGHVIGTEALLRWRHPARGLLPPGDFLPRIVDSDLEGRFGEWVLETALQQLELWLREGIELPVSVNISPNHLQEDNFVERLIAILARYPAIACEKLELEILETAAIDDFARVTVNLNACRRLGVRLSLDDFGTGYSSLAFFRRLPVEILKIDQAFVRDMLEDPDDLSIVESVIRLASAFDRPVIAEGVETLEHGAVLAHLGCCYGQGYGIARPMPAEQLPAWLTGWFQESGWQQFGKGLQDSSEVVLRIAQTNHQRWVEQVARAVIEKQKQPTCKLDSHQCWFGRWYQGSTARLGHLPEFVALKVPHDAIHALAQTLITQAEITQADKHDNEAAKAQLPELYARRDQLVQLLQALNRRIQS